MKVLHLCYGDSLDGGAIGAYRLHRAMAENGVQSRLLVYRKKTEDPSVKQIPLLYRLPIHFASLLSNKLLALQKPPSLSYRSLNIFPTGVHHVINSMSPDIVQMHWINRNTISIAEIAKIRKPVVWKLPDMWAFSGTEHYLTPGDPERYKRGYHIDSRPIGDTGLDIDRWVWCYKKFWWKRKKISIVCPSKWLARCARESVLFNKYPIYNIANPLNLDIYKPMPERQARTEFNLPKDKRLLLFASFNAVGDRRKGFHHLKKSLEAMSNIKRFRDCEIFIMGSKGDPKTTVNGFRVHFLGTLTEDNQIVKAYCAADAVVLPSEADNLPNIIKEATCCGTPCVAFNVGGMPDMIQHRKTGYLAAPFDTIDLARGIAWVLDKGKKNLMSIIHQKAIRLHDPAARVAEYISVYQRMIEGGV